MRPKNNLIVIIIIQSKLYLSKELPRSVLYTLNLVFNIYLIDLFIWYPQTANFFSHVDGLSVSFPDLPECMTWW